MNSQIQKFSVVHQQLEQMMKEEVINQDLFQKSAMKYIAYLAQTDKESEFKENVFDYFCQNNGVAVLDWMLKANSFIAIKAFSLLFINLKEQICINFILCQPFVQQAIEAKSDADEEQWTEYYISFLKSLSIRLSIGQISVFYNKKNSTYPLAFEAMKYFNHPDFMVRTSVMNILLELMKINQAKSKLYFSRFPFTSYLLTFSCEVYELIYNINNKLTSEQQYSQLTSKRISNYHVDLSDYLYYFNDLITFGTEQASVVLRRCFDVYIIRPLFRMLMGEEDIEVRHALLLLAENIKIIKDEQLATQLINLIINPKVKQDYLSELLDEEEVYFPQVYKSKFDPDNFYWNKYRNDIVAHCLEVFEDIKDCAVEGESHKSNNEEFVDEIKRMSEFIHFNLLTNKPIYKKTKGDESHKSELLDNPFRAKLVRLLKNQEASMFYEAVTLLLRVIDNDTCSKNVFRQCQIIRLVGDVSSKSESQMTQFEQYLFQVFFDKILNFRWKKTPFSHLELLIKLFNMLQKGELSNQKEIKLLGKFKDTAFEVMQFVRKQNINEIVENFQASFSIINPKLSNPEHDFQISFVKSLLPAQKWKESEKEHLNAETQKGSIIGAIRQYWYYRIFAKTYLTTYKDKQMIDFGEEYQKYFEDNTCQVSQKYQFSHKKAISCYMLRTEWHKSKRVTVIEDPKHFIIAQVEPDGKEYRVLVKVNWIKVEFQMNRDDSTKIETTITKGRNKDRFNLIFDDQIRSSNVLSNFNDVKWQRYEEELYFIYKFLNRTFNDE